MLLFGAVCCGVLVKGRLEACLVGRDEVGNA